MPKGYTYLIDCSRSSPEEFRNVAAELRLIYEYCDIYPAQPRTLAILRSPDEPEIESSTFNPPPGCIVHHL